MLHNFERRAASMDAWSATAVRPAPASSPLSVVSGPPRAEHTDATETLHMQGLRGDRRFNCRAS